MLYLEHGQPVRFGEKGEKGIVLRGAQAEVVTVGEGGGTGSGPDRAQHGQSVAGGGLLAGQLQPAEMPMAFGIFRDVQKQTYDDLMIQQINEVVAEGRHGDLPRLLRERRQSVAGGLRERRGLRATEKRGWAE